MNASRVVGLLLILASAVVLAGAAIASKGSAPVHKQQARRAHVVPSARSAETESSTEPKAGQSGEPALGHEDPAGEDVNHECTGNCRSDRRSGGVQVHGGSIQVVKARFLALPLVVAAALAAAACGGHGKHASSAPATTSAKPAATRQTTTTTGAAPGALQAEAASAATGDIPDNQVFLVFRSTGGWTMKYPEGWAQSGIPKATTFRDKNNIVRVVVQRGALPSPGKVRSDLTRLGATITSAPKAMTVSGQPALKAVYTTRSAPNSVTGKRVTLTVDRYYLARGGRLATVDLGTPVGVDNVDAYRLMIESFRWR